jgi:hypothetical protein
MARRQVSNRLEEIRRELPQIMSSAHQRFKDETPIDTGNARSKTRLSGNEIQANYPYAVRLEKEGWSRQAPRGMSAPTIEHIKSMVRRILN